MADALIISSYELIGTYSVLFKSDKQYFEYYNDQTDGCDSGRIHTIPSLLRFLKDRKGWKTIDYRFSFHDDEFIFYHNFYPTYNADMSEVK